MAKKRNSSPRPRFPAPTGRAFPTPGSAGSRAPSRGAGLGAGLRHANQPLPANGRASRPEGRGAARAGALASTARALRRHRHLHLGSGTGTATSGKAPARRDRHFGSGTRISRKASAARERRGRSDTGPAGLPCPGVSTSRDSAFLRDGQGLVSSPRAQPVLVLGPGAQAYSRAPLSISWSSRRCCRREGSAGQRRSPGWPPLPGVSGRARCSAPSPAGGAAGRAGLLAPRLCLRAEGTAPFESGGEARGGRRDDRKYGLGFWVRRCLRAPCSSWDAKEMAGFSQDERKTGTFVSSPVTTDICISTALFVWLNEY